MSTRPQITEDAPISHLRVRRSPNSVWPSTPCDIVLWVSMHNGVECIRNRTHNNTPAQSHTHTHTQPTEEHPHRGNDVGCVAEHRGLQRRQAAQAAHVQREHDCIGCQHEADARASACQWSPCAAPRCCSSGAGAAQVAQGRCGCSQASGECAVDKSLAHAMLLCRGFNASCTMEAAADAQSVLLLMRRPWRQQVFAEQAP